MAMPERRQQPRENLNWEATLAHPGHGTLRGQLRNYSTGGMYISIHATNRPTNGPVTLRIYREDVMLMVRGRVVHSDADGVGVLVNEPVTVVELYNGTVYEVTPQVAWA